MLGILGGGQLGRMIAVAAARLGLKVHVFNDDPHSPAFDVAARATTASFADTEALAEFRAGGCAVVTYEFENVPVPAAETVAAHAPLRPGVRALATAQDRLLEKRFVAELGIATAPFRAVDDAASLARALAEIGRPAVLKTRRFGYDGKGQAVIRDGGRPATPSPAIGGRARRSWRASCLRGGSVRGRGRAADGRSRPFDLGAANAARAASSPAPGSPPRSSARDRGVGAATFRRFGFARRSTMSACSRWSCSW